MKTLSFEQMLLTFKTPHETHVNTLPFFAHKEKDYPYFLYIYTIFLYKYFLHFLIHILLHVSILRLISFEFITRPNPKLTAALQ